MTGIDPDAPLDPADFLREKGLPEEEIARILPEFEQRLRERYVQEYGHEPPSAPDPESQRTYLLVGDGGEPIGVFDADAISDAGTKLAFDLAACCDDPDAMNLVQMAALQRIGTASFGYIAANALRCMAEHILSPSFDVAAAHGTDLRAGMREIAEGRQPS